MRGIAGCFRFVFGNCKVELTASLERSRKWFASPILLVLWQTSVGASGEHMGCCSSKAADEPEDPLTGTGICQKQLYPPHISPTGLQVQLSKGCALCATTTTGTYSILTLYVAGSRINGQLDCQPATC